MPFAVFAAEIVLESVLAGAEEAQLVPAASAGMRAETSAAATTAKSRF
jgi:hypothetical protein